jgi:hypothetical protein
MIGLMIGIAEWGIRGAGLSAGEREIGRGVQKRGTIGHGGPWSRERPL